MRAHADGADARACCWIVTAYKLHDVADVVEITELDFDIRDHVNLHAVAAIEGDTPLWVHSHGMEKFGTRDLEIFHLGEDDLLAAEMFLHELCTDMAFGQGPALRTGGAHQRGPDASRWCPPRRPAPTCWACRWRPSRATRACSSAWCRPLGRHNTAELLRPYRERFIPEPEERTESAAARGPGPAARLQGPLRAARG